MNQKIKIIFTDLDGTLADQNNSISNTNRQTLSDLGEKGIIRVIATGRSLYTLRKVIEEEFPVDYVIFSSGSGIFNWKTKEIFYKKNLEPISVAKAHDIFNESKIDFMLHNAIPKNQYLAYKKFNHDNSDFNKRIKIYGELASEFESLYQFSEYSQLLAIIPESRKEILDPLVKRLDFASCILASSPFDHVSVWLEVFPKGVSKGTAAEYLCEQLRINKQNSFSVGNDFNDIHLLDWTEHSYVVDNAHPTLKQKYKVANGNNDDGFTHALLLAEVL